TERTAVTPSPVQSPVATPVAQPVPVATSTPTLPMTGGRDIVPLTALGGALLLLGFGATFAARRRRPTANAASAGGANA
ncbi:MAG: LPXTG cell wall anchor domain-containing protein, partial [Acidothermaceae bacterium]